MVIINEMIEDDTPGGSWCHVLSLSCQMLGKPLPDRDTKEAFSRAMRAMKFVPEESLQEPGLITLPSGLVVRR